MLTEKTHAGGFLMAESAGHRSRDSVTLLSGQNLYAGTVLGKITSGGKYVAYDPNAGDGSQTAVAVLFGRGDASAGDTLAAVISRDAEVNGNELVKKATSPGIVNATMDANLALQHIIVRR